MEPFLGPTWSRGQGFSVSWGGPESEAKWKKNGGKWRKKYEKKIRERGALGKKWKQENGGKG